MELSVARGAMQLIKEEGAEEMLIKSGISQDLFDKVKGDTPWKGSDRAEVTRCLDALNHGCCDIVGVPRIALPAEYIAASIANFVHPVNVKLACNWCEVKSSASEMAGSNSKSVQHENISSDRLFSLVVMLIPGHHNYMEEGFKKAVEKAVEEYMEKPEPSSV